MQQILLGVQVVLALSIIVLVLLQQGRGADAGASFGGGSSGSLFGSRGPASFLARATGLLAAVFFANSVGLAYFATEQVRAVSVLETAQPLSSTSAPMTPADVPVAPGANAPVTVTGDVPKAPNSAPATSN
ncbi:MAG: preprotein translocase subunit SecG [Gammaproteobacteria bacterium]